MCGVPYHTTKENRKVRRDFRRIAYCIMTGTVWKEVNCTCKSGKKGGGKNKSWLTHFGPLSF